MARAVEPHAAEQPLARYNNKRDFKVTSEPSGMPVIRGKKPRTLGFVIQKHWASRLHYDVRLELDGVMLSWAVPKGPPFDPALKQMPIHVEDHPLSYNTFEGTIPKGQYGAGTVIASKNEPTGNVCLLTANTRHEDPSSVALVRFRVPSAGTPSPAPRPFPAMTHCLRKGAWPPRRSRSTLSRPHPHSAT
jgi:DNA ligase D-like protein (predicted 3'-phosphoesterase)